MIVADPERTIPSMALPPEVARRRFTAAEYHQMAEAGILTAAERVELIEGEIVQMTPIGRRHALCVASLTSRLVPALAGRALLWPQNPIVLPNDTEPQPDIVLLRPPMERYADVDATAPDILLLIEVADSSLRYDRLVKRPLYARAGIPEVWIVDVGGDAIEVCRRPSPAGYAEMQRVGGGGVVSPEAFPDVVLSLDEILVLPRR